jgi:ATP phosphoribosyltransferase regulatory subunit HisZ
MRHRTGRRRPEEAGSTLPDLPVSFDLADLRGYHYHSGVVFAAYCTGHPGAIALGGRYDKVGKSFGRGRPATGFSLDLRELCQLAPAAEAGRAILAPAAGDQALREAVAALRAGGEIVIEALPGHDGTWARPAATGSWCGAPENGRLKTFREKHRKWQRTSSSSAPSGVTRARARSSTG